MPGRADDHDGEAEPDNHQRPGLHHQRDEGEPEAHGLRDAQTHEPAWNQAMAGTDPGDNPHPGADEAQFERQPPGDRGQPVGQLRGRDRQPEDGDGDELNLLARGMPDFRALVLRPDGMRAVRRYGSARTVPRLPSTS